MIDACVKSILDFADEIVITDGTSIIGQNNRDGRKIDSECQASNDGTVEYLRKLEAAHDKIFLLENGGSKIMEECVVKTVQYEIADSDWFMIVDADEIWMQEDLNALRDFLDACSADVDDIAIQNRVFMWNPWHFIYQGNWRIFRKREDRRFYEANAVTDSKGGETAEGVKFFHYGYVDSDRVKFKCNYYSGPYYQDCGPWWYENVFKKYDGRNIKELIKLNNGTLHPWGKISPEFAKNEWGKLRHYYGGHPAVMKEYFESQGWLNVGYLE
jgi:hypothetical protein